MVIYFLIEIKNYQFQREEFGEKQILVLIIKLEEINNQGQGYYILMTGYYLSQMIIMSHLRILENGNNY